SWTKSRSPVFVSDTAAQRYGPGHNSFTTTADGEVVLVYHPRTYTRIEANALDDPNRHASAQVLPLDTDGTPIWATPLAAAHPAPAPGPLRRLRMSRLDTPAAPDPSSEPGASAADSTTSAPHARSAPPARSAGSPLKKPVFWNFGGLFFFYFAIWQLAFTF